MLTRRRFSSILSCGQTRLKPGGAAQRRRFLRRKSNFVPRTVNVNPLTAAKEACATKQNVRVNQAHRG